MKYRIIEWESPTGKKCYEVQKRLFGFLWWYNFENDDAYTTGFYDKIEDARAAIKHNKTEIKKKIVYTE